MFRLFQMIGAVSIGYIATKSGYRYVKDRFPNSKDREIRKNDHILYKQRFLRFGPGLFPLSFEAKSEHHPMATDCDEECMKGFKALDKCCPGKFVQEKKFIAANNYITGLPEFEITNCVDTNDSLLITADRTKDYTVMYNIKRIKDKDPRISHIYTVDGMNV